MAKKICSLVLLVFWMACIFAFSAQPAEESTKLSDSVKEKVIEIVERVFPSVAEKAAKPDGETTLIKIIRKSAHFFAYLILGVLAMWTFSAYGIKKRYGLAFLLCVLYAISDEIHQAFVPGRACRLFDVCIDTAGAALGLFAVFLIKKRKKCLTK
ncbi:MAG: VanZ family protein [Clostridia bacterium]|nr:VanZ family protein [Clostridia bacterium]